MFKHFHSMMIFFSLFILSSEILANSPWSNGYMPSWVKNCEQAEKNFELDDLKNYNHCTSKGFTGFKDDLKYYSSMDYRGRYNFQGISSVHVVVTDAALDRSVPDVGLCTAKMCYRAYVYINGDENSGEHIATWATTPGKPWSDGSGNYTPESLYVYQNSPKINQNSKGDFLLQKDNEMGLAGKVTAKVPGYFVMDHYVNSNGEDMGWATFYHYGIAFHSSYTVNGDVGSHGCTRLKYVEAKKMNYLARHVGRRFSVETRFTERRRLNRAQRNKVMLQLDPKRMQKIEELQNSSSKGDIRYEDILVN